MTREQQESLIRDWVRELAERSTEITAEEWKTLALNTYERNFLLTKLDNDALTELCIKYLENVTAKTYPTTYEETIVTCLFPEVLTRLQHIRGRA